MDICIDILIYIWIKMNSIVNLKAKTNELQPPSSLLLTQTNSIYKQTGDRY